MSSPPPGVDKEEWLKLSKFDQEALIERIQAEHAEEQREWERRAHEAWEASEHDN